MPSLLQTWALPIALLSIANISATWYNVVSKEVPEPYLDEFFHIPQAQRYCNRDYSWDPKITTPPGLYAVSLLLRSVIGCDIPNLRGLNSGAIGVLCPLVYGILRLLRKSSSREYEDQDNKGVMKRQGPVDDQTLVLDAHSALNICLFPPLFFFSALYYTDVVSTLTVLLSYSAFLKQGSTTGNLMENFNAVSVGILALLFRQTNVFWVAVFPAGLAAIEALKEDQPKGKAVPKQDIRSVLENSWTEGLIHDVQVQRASPLDYILFLISTATTAIRKPALVLKAVMPYVVIIALFAGFVAWNGGVVLGDKSAHVATIHLPQMLYFWPFLVFFAAPLTANMLLKPLFPLLPSHFQTFSREYITGDSNATIPGAILSVVIVLTGLLTVHFNTIIHPYTLADNRHYVFYVFKIFRLYPMIKYLAVPVYYVCAWLALGLLGSTSRKDEAEISQKDEVQPTKIKIDRQPCQVSFITIWLVATTMSVVSAPLVEPRYFIIPWVIWRLHVSYLPVSISPSSSTGKAAYDLRLVFETIWFLLINTIVGFVFLYRGFPWANEPGKIQRFLW